MIKKLLTERPEEFSFKESQVGGDECILIGPNNIKTKWTEETLMFRSLIVRESDCKIISRGFNKFFNYSEHPELDVFPEGPFTAVEKRDGSLIIWGVHNNELIHRTRGTFNAKSMENGHEIDFFIKKYPKLIRYVYSVPEYSILTEWETKTNIIVINSVEEPTLTLVGIIDNRTGKLAPQDFLDTISLSLGIDRPKTYEYGCVSECILDVKSWVGKEGVCLYSKCGQHIRKTKSEWYLSLHALATGIKNVNQVIDLFMTTERFTKYEHFYNYVEETLDHEIAEKIKDDMLLVVNAYNCVLDNLQKINKFVDGLRGESFNRKNQAIEITKRWSDWRAGVSFKILDNKEIEEKFIRKGIEFCLEKQKNETQTP